MDVLSWQNPKLALREFDFDGIEYYADRAINNAGAVILADGLDQGVSAGWLDYLRHEARLCADEVIQVHAPSGDLYEGVLADELVTRRVLQLVLELGYRIDFFNTRAGIEEEVVSRLGLEWRQHVISPPSWLSDMGNSKAYVRELADRLGLDVLPPGAVASGRHAIRRTTRRLQKRLGGEQVLKQDSWASGLGLRYVRSRQDVKEFIAEHPGRLTRVIVEQSLGEHTAMSVNRRYANGSLVDLWWAGVLNERKDAGISQVGNVLDPAMSEQTSLEFAWMVRSTDLMTSHFLRRLPWPFTGTVCWDAAKSKSTGQLRILECNIRTVSTSCLRRIQERLRQRTHVEPAVIALDIAPTRARTFHELRQALGQDLYRCGHPTGILPHKVRCLRAKEPYCMLVAIAPDADQCRELMRTGIHRACGREAVARVPC